MQFKGDLEALILGVLEGTELHGYQIAKQIRQLSDEALDIGEGKLYPSLHDMEQKGIVEAEWFNQSGKPSRRVYRLTETGHHELERKREEWRRFANGVAAVLAARDPEPGHDPV
jgi:transcriptional regulator